MSEPVFRKVKLGSLLVQQKLITDEQLEEALAIQKESGGKLGTILVNLQFIQEPALLKVVAYQLGLPFIDLRHYQINPDMVQKLPERLARRYRAVVINFVEGQYLVGMNDPTDVIAYDELTHFLKGHFKVAVVSESDLLHVIDLVYRRTGDIVSFAQELKEEIGIEKVSDIEELGAESAPVARLLDSIFEDAVQMNASDIHIEPDEKSLRIRQRIDGVLQEHIVREKEIIAALVLRIKLTAKMNISERRIPQDGRIFLTIKGRRIDVRVSTMPVQYGESVVMRLLNQEASNLKLEQLGMPPKILERISVLIRKPHGMILNTGPTGSGKTTTLYAALSALNSAAKKIITIEDPVEYTLARINQVQVNLKVGLTFASVLRASLRQDPDIIMVGEMRDEETVQTGLRAALTGHLVLSTLHTNDAISCAIRLVDMGAKGYLVAGALRGVLAQRLVRKICQACIVDYKPTEQEMTWLRGIAGDRPIPLEFKCGKGCNRCNNTGYRERLGVYELLEMDTQLADALRMNDTVAFNQIALKQPHYTPLHLSALDYAIEGITTITEMFRLAGESYEVC